MSRRRIPFTPLQVRLAVAAGGGGHHGGVGEPGVERAQVPLPRHLRGHDHRRPPHLHEGRSHRHPPRRGVRPRVLLPPRRAGLNSEAASCQI